MAYMMLRWHHSHVPSEFSSVNQGTVFGRLKKTALVQEVPVGIVINGVLFVGELSENLSLSQRVRNDSI